MRINQVISVAAVAQIPGANIKEFLLTILSEAKRPQIQCLSPKGAVLERSSAEQALICSEANFRMVRNSFQRAKWDLGNKPLSTLKVPEPASVLTELS